MVVATLTKNVIFLGGKIWHNVDMKPGRAVSGVRRRLRQNHKSEKEGCFYHEMSYH